MSEMSEDELQAALTEELKAVALGDEDATARVARFIASRVASTDASAAQSFEEQRAQQYLQAEKAHRDFLNALGGSMKDNPDVYQDDEYYERLKKEDTRIATTNPGMHPVERLAKAVDRTRAVLGPPEDRDHSRAVRLMQRDHSRNVLHLANDDTDDVNTPEMNAEQERWSEGIQQMMDERERLKAEAGQQVGRRPDERPKPQRAVPWIKGVNC